MSLSLLYRLLIVFHAALVVASIRVEARLGSNIPDAVAEHLDATAIPVLEWGVFRLSTAAIGVLLLFAGTVSGLMLGRRARYYLSGSFALSVLLLALLPSPSFAYPVQNALSALAWAAMGAVVVLSWQVPSASALEGLRLNSRAA